jgi:hypothetical protein
MLGLMLACMLDGFGYFWIMVGFGLLLGGCCMRGRMREGAHLYACNSLSGCC